MSSSADPVSAALESVVSRFAEMVRRVGGRHGLSEHEVDEMFQEVRIRLWRARASSEKIAASPASYLYRTTVSAALDLIRRRRARREQPFEVFHAGNGEVALGSSAPDRDLEAAELAAQVARLVETLPESRRPVVRMYLAGYAREEIAELFGWSEAKTRNLLYRGLADLRARLQEQGVGPGASP